MADSKPNIAALIAQMPDTDQQKLNPKDPAAAGIHSKFTGPEPEVAEKVFAAIIEGGRESILELLAALREPGDAGYTDYKARYVLHGMCLHAGLPGKEEQRRLLAETLASQLKGGSLSTPVKRSLIRELQVAGEKESISALAECLADTDLCDSAVQALLAIRTEVAEPLRKALSNSKGRNLLAVIQALGVLQDRESVATLRKFLTHDESDVRRISAWALANIGDADSAGAILKLASAATGWERTHATGFCHLLAEKLAAAGQKDAAARIYTNLRDTRKDPEERHVRETADRALKALQ